MITLDEFENAGKGDFLKITANDDWNGHIGIVHEVIHSDIDKVLQLFCIQKPMWLYNVHKNNLHSVEKFKCR